MWGRWRQQLEEARGDRNGWWCVEGLIGGFLVQVHWRPRRPAAELLGPRDGLDPLPILRGDSFPQAHGTHHYLLFVFLHLLVCEQRRVSSFGGGFVASDESGDGIDGGCLQRLLVLRRDFRVGRFVQLHLCPDPAPSGSLLAQHYVPFALPVLRRY